MKWTSTAKSLARLLVMPLLAILLAGNVHAAVSPVVYTRDGAIKGIEREQLDVFLGIPFAAPPVGKLRWRAPQPVHPWAGVLAATQYRPACMQKGMYPPDAPLERISEDCLYLNIWKPARANVKRLPVMVWIYGGGLENGSGAAPLYAGGALAHRGVIVVTINYRLGVFGFLSLPALTAESGHHSSGNYGLMDQLAALRWVHDNIAAFGGNPDNVTVFGQSSGSISISALTASPLARGLFEKAIGESGGLFEPMELASQLSLAGAEQQGEQFMKRAGAGSLNDLRKAPAAKLLKVPFSPNIIIDGYVLPRAPWRIYADGKANRVPLLIGWNADEGAFFVGRHPVTPVNYRTRLDRTFPSLLVHLLAPAPGHTDASAGAAFVKFNTDMRFRWDMWRWATLAVERDDDPVYVYEFTRAPPFTAASPYVGLGPAHGVEMEYVFDHLSPKAATWDEADRRLSAIMPAFWTNFAKTGTPNELPLPHWPRFEASHPDVMRFGTTIKAGPIGSIQLLQRISEIYRASRDVMRFWPEMALLALVTLAGLIAAIIQYRGRKQRRSGH